MNQNGKQQIQQENLSQYTKWEVMEEDTQYQPLSFTDVCYAPMNIYTHMDEWHKYIYRQNDFQVVQLIID